LLQFSEEITAPIAAGGSIVKLTYNPK